LKHAFTAALYKGAGSLKATNPDRGIETRGAHFATMPTALLEGHQSRQGD